MGSAPLRHHDALQLLAAIAATEQRQEQSKCTFPKSGSVNDTILELKQIIYN